jgi:hypothetical protein
LAISANGAYAFDTSLNTTTAFDGGGSCVGGDNIEFDAYYQWTAPAAGDYQFDTEGSTFDTQLSLHLGTGCAATCSFHDDDGGSGLLSRIQLTGALAGDTYLIQVGGYTGNQGAGNLNIGPVIVPCAALDALEPNDSCVAPATLVAGNYPNLSTSFTTDSDFFDVVVPAGNILTVTMTGISGDPDVNTFDSGCVFTATLAAGFSYSNLSAVSETINFEVFADVPNGAVDCAEYTLDIALAPDPCFGASDDAMEDNDTCLTAGTMAIGVHTNLFVSTSDEDYYSITIPTDEILTITETNLSGDTTLDLYDSTCTDLGFFGGTYTNSTGAPETVILQVVANVTGGLSCATYDLDVSTAPDPCATGADDAFEDNDDCATATVVTDGTYPGLFVSSADNDHFAFCVADGATVSCDILFIDAVADVDFFLRDAASIECGNGNGTEELADGFSATDNESFTWTNTTGADLDVVLEVNVFTTNACNDYDLIIAGSGCGPGVVGVPFCDPATLNSTGAPAVLAGSFGTGVGSDLHLEATDGPPTQIGYFLAGNEATAGISVSNGLLCLVGTGTSNLYRYNVSGGASNSIGIFDAAGVLQNVVSTSLVGSGFDVPATIPDSPPITIMAGDTWHFQCWFRDTAAAVGSSNFTNGLSVTF